VGCGRAQGSCGCQTRKDDECDAEASGRSSDAVWRAQRGSPHSCNGLLVGPTSSESSAAFPRLGLLALCTPLFLLSCGDGGPVGLDTSDLEVILVQGDRQASGPEARLPFPMEVRVQKKGSQAPVEGSKVRWEVVAGSGAGLDPLVSETDSLGLAAAYLTLGSTLGTYRVRASVRGMESYPAEFSAEAILLPVLVQVPSGPVQNGEIVQLQGTNFSLDQNQNVVTFSGVRARVVSGTTSQLQVEVPPCLPPRDYQLRVRIGALSTETAALEVVGDPESLVLDPAQDRVLDASEAFSCFHLPFDPGSLYLVVPHSTATVGGAEHGFSLTALTSDGISPDPQYPLRTAEEKKESRLDAQTRWDEKVRGMEAELLSRRELFPSSEGIKIPEAAGPSAVPQVGDRRTFKVLNNRDEFDRVRAKLHFVTDHSLVYVDEDAPSDGFTELDLAALALEFEDPIYTTITDIFGIESDVDRNGRVIILFTAAVNRLTDSESEGYVAGFFYGLDLLEGKRGSNEGEIFYAMVPDPLGEEGLAIPRYTALTTIPAILAHEFEHMVHFNQRVLLGGAETTEVLWLSEALALMAEDLVGTAYSLAQNHLKAHQYRSGNWNRAGRFLEHPSQVSVLAFQPPGTLEERGAGWLLLKQVSGRPGQDDLLAILTSSTSSGVQNLTEATGLEWEEMVADWAGSLFLDGTTVPVRPELEVSGVNLRWALSLPGGGFPLRTRSFGSQSAQIFGSLWSSAPDYFIISPPAGGVALSAGGPPGGLPEAALGLQVLVVRLQ